MLFNPLYPPIMGGFLKRIGDTPKTPVLPRKDTSFLSYLLSPQWEKARMRAREPINPQFPRQRDHPLDFPF